MIWGFEKEFPIRQLITLSEGVFLPKTGIHKTGHTHTGKIRLNLAWCGLVQRLWRYGFCKVQCMCVL